MDDEYTNFSLPQNQPVPGEPMVHNKAGGYAFQADIWTRLRRFLILGSDGSTFYTSPKKLTVDNASVVLSCIKADVLKTLATIVSVSESGVAPSNDAALFAYALLISYCDEDDRNLTSLPFYRIARTGTHLFTFAKYVKSMRGWGPVLRRAIANWYLNQTVEDLSYQMVKYRNRGGWSHADLLRLSHPKGATFPRTIAFQWALGKKFVDSEYPSDLSYIRQYELVKNATDIKDVVRIVRSGNNLPWEAVPTKWHKYYELWEALIDDMPIMATLRNLGRFSSLGMTNYGSPVLNAILEKFSSTNYPKKSRVHPMKVFLAIRTYQKGTGDKGNLNWIPNPMVVDALNKLFYLSMSSVVTTSKRILVAVDESSSMNHRVSGSVDMTCYEAGMAMATILMKTQPNAVMIGFSSRVSLIEFSPEMTVTDLVNRRASGGSTDCSLPFKFAENNHEDFDAIVSFSDSESWAGGEHLFQIAKRYRETRNPNLLYVSMQLEADDTSLLSPDMVASNQDLEIVGLDSSAYEVMSEFLTGKF
jgi:60 kDa SS-A/Ro ribonucleoprotein